MEVEFAAETKQILADAHVGNGVTVLLVRDIEGPWELWGIQIDGARYREPRDLAGQPLQAGDFLYAVQTEEKRWAEARSTQ